MKKLFLIIFFTSSLFCQNQKAELTPSEFAAIIAAAIIKPDAIAMGIEKNLDAELIKKAIEAKGLNESDIKKYIKLSNKFLKKHKEDLTSVSLLLGGMTFGSLLTAMMASIFVEATFLSYKDKMLGVCIPLISTFFTSLLLIPVVGSAYYKALKINKVLKSYTPVRIDSQNN